MKVTDIMRELFLLVQFKIGENTMREEYKKELKDLKTKMEKAEKFAEKVPLFVERILEYKFSGEESNQEYLSRYKQIYFHWSLYRTFYTTQSEGCKPTNYKGKDFSHHLFHVYINTLTLYNVNEEFGLYDALKEIDIFYTDHLNTTFYIDDENIEPFLEALNIWYLNACEESKKACAKKSLEDAEKEIEKLRVDSK